MESKFWDEIMGSVSDGWMVINLL